MTSTSTEKPAAKKATAKPAAKRPTPAPAKKAAQPAKAAEPKAAAAAPTSPTYREVADFTPALKAAKASAKGNADLTQPLQLITHLGWKTPGGSVGWAKGTTANVVAYADDIAVPAGTPIPDAMDAALSAAAKAATDQPQKDAVAVLSKVVKAHS